MKIVFGIHDFYGNNIFLQPRYFVYNIAKQLIELGHEVVVVTNGYSGKIDKIVVTDAQSLRKNNHARVLRVLQNLHSDIVVWSISPFNVIASYDSFYSKIEKPLVGNFSFPYYHLSEVVKAQSSLSLAATFRYYINSCVSKRKFAQLLNRDVFCLIVCQSSRNIKRLTEVGVSRSKICGIAPGMDKCNRRESHHRFRNRCFTFLYAGAVRPIRGINILLKAFKKLDHKHRNVHLKILSRDTPSYGVNALRNVCKKMAILDRVEIVADWLNRQDYVNHIRSCDVVVLPYVLIQSDMPVTVLDAFSLGKPVISTDLDGMSEVVSNKGILIKHNDVGALRNAMESILNDSSLYEKLRREAINYADTYPTWRQTAKHFLQEIEGIKL